MRNNNLCVHCKVNMREKWLKLYLEQGLPITEVAKLSGFHPDTLYIWKRNYLGTGIEGLVEQSRAPHRHPNEYSNDIKEKIRLLRKDGKGICANIIKIRLAKRYGIRISRSGIADFLSKDGLVNAKLSRRIKNKKERIKASSFICEANTAILWNRACY